METEERILKVLITTSTFNSDIVPKEWKTKFNPFQRRLSEQEVSDLIDSFDPIAMVAGTEPITRKVLRRSKSLRVISRCGSGLDSIDLEEAENLGIKILNTPDTATAAVAELTIGLILEMLRNIRLSDLSIRESLWYRPMGNLLKGKIVGIVGCGRIGTYVAELLKVFGCKLIGYDSYLEEHKNITLKSLESVLTDSDIISLHLPYSSETHHMIGNEQFKLMKKNSFIVNTSRGGLLDEQSLFEYIKTGHIKGAAIDCFEMEPYRGDLTSIDNVVMTAHIGSYAIEAREMQEKQAIENLIIELEQLGLI